MSDRSGAVDVVSVSERPYTLLPLNFIRLDDRIVLTNLTGEHELVDEATFLALRTFRLSRDSPAYLNLKAKHFLQDSSSTLPLTLLATKYRTKHSFLSGFTKLHIFVVTLRCDHSCQYCQVSRVSANRSRYDMARESADRALDLVFRTPATAIKIEFQGGEPLLNWDLVAYITDEAIRRNTDHGKDIRFVLTTNLSLLTEEILDFLRDRQIVVSTSLDGPAFIHNANRPRPGNDAYDLAVAGIDRVRQALGHDAVSALMTTTRLSLDHPEAIVDEYHARGFDHVFLRPLSPYGFAAKTSKRTGYEVEAFLSFYTRALRRIIEINRGGTMMVEVYAQILLTKILTPYATGYVDLQSPSGAGIGVVVYNYDGDVYVSDEARMLAEMGDTTFRLGNVHTDSYETMFGGDLLRSLVAASCVESLPRCHQCAFQTYCGADPIENHATQGNVIGHRPTSRFCHRNMTIIKHLLRLYHGEDPFVRELFWSWVHRVPYEALVPRLPE